MAHMKLCTEITTQRIGLGVLASLLVALQALPASLPVALRALPDLPALLVALQTLPALLVSSLETFSSHRLT